MQFNYDSILTELQDRLSLLSNWTKTLFYGVYNNILSVVAYITEKLAYKAQVYYRESVWSTAQYKKSLILQSKWISYVPHRKIGASGNIVVSADENLSSGYTYTGESVTIPKWTQFTNAEGDVLVYAIDDYIYYRNTVGNLTIAVKEGEVKQYTYTASGTDNEVIEIFSDSVEDNSIEEDYVQVDIVDINGNVLYNVGICGDDDIPEKLYFITDTNNYYCEVENANDFQSVKIIFGDGVYGKRLPVGARVRVTYAETKGSEGNITTTGVITTLVDTVYDGLGNEVDLYATNNSEISNGQDIESFEDIKYYGPRLFISGYRCGSYDDWQTILESHSYIKSAQVAGMDDLGYTDSAYRNKVFVTAISTDGSTLTGVQKEEVVLDLKEQNRKSVTEVISWLDPAIITVFAKINAWVENQPFTTINTLIDDALETNYGALYTEFQTNIYESNFINVVDDVEYIRYHDSEIYHLEKDWGIQIEDEEIAVSYTSSDTSDKEKQIYLQPDTIELWLKRKVGGSWNSPVQIAGVISGVITGLSGDLSAGDFASKYTINDSNINETNNTISYTVQTMVDYPLEFGVRDPGSGNSRGYILSVAYKTKDGNGSQKGHIRLPKSNFITDVDDDYIHATLEYV